MRYKDFEGTANHNYREYLLDDMVKYKKYFYVLRPVLACKWISERRCPPPVLFSELVESVLEPELRETVEQLVTVKMQMRESEKGKRVDVLNIYIEEKLAEYKKRVQEMPEAACRDWDGMNRLFREMVMQTCYV